MVYIILLIKVIRVYFPRKVIDPFIPTNYFPEVPPVSVYDDPEENKRIGDQYWYFAMDTYIKPTDIDHFYDVLREYIDVIMEQYLQNQELEKELRFAFQLLPPMAIMTVLLFVLG